MLLRTCLGYVCVSVHEYISRATGPNFTVLSQHVTCGRGSILLWRRFDTLHTSGSVDNASFAHNGREYRRCDKGINSK